MYLPFTKTQIMRALLVFMVFLVFMVVGRWFFICQVRGICVPEAPEDVRLNTLLFRDGDTIVLRGFDHFAFDSASVIPRMNDNNHAFIDSVALYLQHKENKSVTITGRYAPFEKDMEFGFYENIGVARADAVRDEMKTRGIPEDRITLDYQLDQTGSLRRPLAFDAFLTDSTEFKKQAFTFTNMSFTDANFEFGSAEFLPGVSCIAYMDSVHTFMELNPESSLTIVGHTDSIATEAFNLRLGLNRAKSTKAYMQNLGVPEERMSVDSEGELQPVAPNRTDEGRQKNRRVDFIIQEKQ